MTMNRIIKSGERSCYLCNSPAEKENTQKNIGRPPISMCAFPIYIVGVYFPRLCYICVVPIFYSKQNMGAVHI